MTWFDEFDRRRRAERRLSNEHVRSSAKQLEWMRQLCWHLEQGHRITDLDGCLFVEQSGQLAGAPLVPLRGTRALIKAKLIERVQGDPRAWQLAPKAEAMLAYRALGGSFDPPDPLL